MPRIVKGSGKGKEKEWKYSTFFLTINTNRQDYDRQKLREVLDRLYGDDDMFYSLIAGEGLDTIDRDYTIVEFAIEVGKVGGKIHSHALIMMRHKGRIRLNIQLLRTVLKKALGLSDLHIDVKASGDTIRRLADYIRKDIEVKEV